MPSVQPPAPDLATLLACLDAIDGALIMLDMPTGPASESFPFIPEAPRA